MPTFLQTMRRILRGEPVFRPEESDGPHNVEIDTPPEAASSQRPSLDTHAETHRTDGKIAPIVVMQRVNCHIHDERMDMSVVVHNQHIAPVFVDKIMILGKRWDLDRTLQPDEVHEFMFYKGGPRPRDTQNATAELWYRDGDGCYFASRHYVKYDQLHDGRLTISEFHFLPPIRAI